MQRIMFGEPWTTTLVQKTLLFLQNTKIKVSEVPFNYLIICIDHMSYRIRQCNKIPAINVTHEFFKDFFPSTIIECNKLDWKIKRLESIETFQKRILSFIRASPNSTFNCLNPKRVRLLSRLRLGLSHQNSNTVFKIFSISSAVVEKVKLKLVLTICSIFTTIW